MAKDDYDEDPEDVIEEEQDVEDDQDEDDEADIDLELDALDLDDVAVDEDDTDEDLDLDVDVDAGEDEEEDEAEDEEEEDAAADDEAEESLDVLLAREQGDEEGIVRLDEEPRDGLVSVTTPIGADEFTCQSCFLVKRRAQLADAKQLICLDCA